MKPIVIHPIIFYLFLFMMFTIFCAFLWFVWAFIKRYVRDTLIFLEKTNRWKIIYDKIGSNPFYTYKNKKYVTNEGILNRKGRALFVFSEGKPNPMEVKYNNTKWLSSDSLMSIINNKLVQQLVKTSDDFKDKLIMFGAIGGILACIASILILLKTFGVM